MMFGFNDTQLMMRDAAQDFAERAIAPEAVRWDKDHHVPVKVFKELGQLGFYGLLVPESEGGTDSGYLALALVVEELAKADGASSTVVSVMNSVVCAPVAQFGSQAQKRQWLAPLVSGEMLGCFALTEPQAGSDAGALQCRAKRRGEHWQLSGTKQFITNGSIAEVALVFAVTAPAKGKQGISAFLVPMHLPGATVPKVESKLGQHASDTAQLHFDDVLLDACALLGEEGEGYRIALSNLEGGRIGIAAQCVGMAQAAFDLAAGYAGQRTSFNQPLMSHQAVAFRLAEMETQIETARQMVYHAARRKDAGLPALREAAMAKLYASEMAEKVVSDAMQTLGGYGYLSEYPIEKIYRDVRVARIYEGTSDIQKMLIARDIERRFL